MPGFLGKVGSIRAKTLFNDNKNDKLINKMLYFDDFYIEQRTINKFLNDKVFEENDSYFILTEGVILNSVELINKYNASSFFETIINMYKQNGYGFFSEFRGSFSGIFYDKKII